MVPANEAPLAKKQIRIKIGEEPISENLYISSVITTFHFYYLREHFLAFKLRLLEARLKQKANQRIVPKYFVLPLWHGWCFLKKTTASLFGDNETWYKVWFEVDTEIGCLNFLRSPELTDSHNMLLGNINIPQAVLTKENGKKKPHYRLHIKDRRGKGQWIAFENDFDRARYYEAFCGLAETKHIAQDEIIKFEQRLLDENITENDDDDENVDFWNCKVELVDQKQVKEIAVSSLIQPSGTVFVLLRHCTPSYSKLLFKPFLIFNRF